MAATELASGYVSIGGDTRALGRDVRGMFGQIETQAGNSGNSSSSRFAGAFSKGLKVAGLATVGAAGGLLATAFTKGFTRLNAIDQAEAKLKGLGRSAADIKSIMDSTTKSVKGTAFGLDEAANSAAMFSTVGVKTGTEMDRIMKLLADTTAQAGSSFSDIAPIFAKIKAQGSLTTETFDQLNERATGVGEALSKHLGIPMDQVRDKAKNIKFEDFAAAMEKNIGGAAQATGDTFKGAMDNTMAALGRFGAKLLTPAFKVAPSVFGGITTGIDSVTKAVEPFIGNVLDKLGGAFEGLDLGTVKESFVGLGESAVPVLKDFGDRFKGLGENLAEFGGNALPLVKDGLGGLWAIIEPTGRFVADVLVVGFQTLVSVFSTLVDWGAQVTGFFNEHRTVLTVIGGIIATVVAPQLIVMSVLYAAVGIAALKSAAQQTLAWLKTSGGALKAVGVSLLASAQIVGAWILMGAKATWEGIKVVAGWAMTGAAAVKNAAISVFNAGVIVGSWVLMGAQSALNAAVIAGAWLLSAAQSGIAIASTLAYAAAQGVVKLATMAWTAVQWALNSALLANPITWIVLAIVALVAIIVLVATKTKFFQTVWGYVWNFVKAAWETVWNGLKAGFEAMVGFFTETIPNAAGKMKDWVVEKWTAMVDFIKGIPGAIASVAGKMWEPIKDAFKTVVNFIIRGWNAIADKLSFTVPDIVGVPRRGETISPIPRVSEFAEGGWTGPGSKFKPAGVVHADEFVVNKKARGRFERNNPGVLDYINATGRMPGYAEGGRVLSPWNGGGGEGGLKPIAVMVRRMIHKWWPEITDIGGYRASDPFPDHPSGQALDIMTSALKVGDAVKAWLMDNRDILKLNYTIWQQKYEPASGGGNIMEDRGSPTQNHMDHIHALFGQIGNPPAANVNMIPEGLKFPAHVKQEDAVNPFDQQDPSVTAMPQMDTPLADPETKEPYRPAKSIKEFMGSAGKIMGESLFDILMPSSALPDPLAIKDRYTITDSDAENAPKPKKGVTAAQLRKAQNKVITAQDNLGVATARYDEIKKDPKAKESSKLAAKARMEKAARDLDDAKRAYAELQEPANTANTTTGRVDSSPAPADTGPSGKPGHENYVSDIAKATKSMGMSLDAATIAVGTALVESGNPLKMWANNAVPDSLNYPHDAVGSDHDSVGLFQQRDNGAWGTLKERMSAFDSAKLFLGALKKVSGWESMPKGQAAQAVQRSAFPDRYEGQMPLAKKMLIGKFDRGGVVPPGISLVENKLRRYEQAAVFTPGQWDTLKELPNSGGSIDARMIIEKLVVGDWSGGQRELKKLGRRHQMQYQRS